MLLFIAFQIPAFYTKVKFCKISKSN